MKQTKSSQPFTGPIKKGECRNPSGKNGWLTDGAWQPFRKRAQYLLGRFTLTQIQWMSTDLKRLDKYLKSSWDGIVCKRLAAMVNGTKEEREELRLLLDYAETKPKQEIEMRVIRSVKDLTEDELRAIAESSKVG